MGTFPPLVLGTEESSKLQSRIKVELAQRQWSEGEDDDVMAEYILVMLANNKTSEQIANELKELIGEGSGENSGGEGGVDDFVDWIWQERSRIANGSDVKMESLSSGASEAKSREQWRTDVPSKTAQGQSYQSKRRSLSPERRSSPSDPASLLSRPAGTFGGRNEGRWEDSHRGQRRDQEQDSYRQSG